MKKRTQSSPTENAAATRQRHLPETRAQMIERLTNPLISLHEAGVILGVCAATLRNYSDSGLLPHERTVGGQRRFRLKQVLLLLEDREKRRQQTRYRRTRGRVRSAQLRSEPRKAASVSAPVISERERREIEGRNLLEATRARAQARLSQAAAQKNQARDTPPARAVAPSRIVISRLSSLGRAQMNQDKAQHEKAQRDDD